MVEFELEQGMKNNELLDALKGKVSGESRQQVQEYLSAMPRFENYNSEGLNIREVKKMLYEQVHCRKKIKEAFDNGHLKHLFDAKTGKYTTHEVIAVDHVNHYAVIAKHYYEYQKCEGCGIKHMIGLATPSRQPHYLLCGLNSDDQMYFLHPLWEVPTSLISAAQIDGKVMPIVNWCNRTDMGFEQRVQGDVIAATVTPVPEKISCNMDLKSEGKAHSKVTYGFNMGGEPQGFMLNLQHPSFSELESRFHTGIMHSSTRKKNRHRGGFTELFHDFWHNRVKSELIQQHSDYSLSAAPKKISIGNRHTVSTDGMIVRITLKNLPSKAVRQSLGNSVEDIQRREETARQLRDLAMAMGSPGNWNVTNVDVVPQAPTPTPPRPMALGGEDLRSVMFVDEAQGMRNIFVVMGSYMMMEHPEHPMVMQKIPDNAAMVIGIQRGSVNNGLDD